MRPYASTVAGLAALVSIGACSSTSSAPTATDALTGACIALTIADASFQAAAPALVVAGKLSQADLAKEKAIVAGLQATCANPPADVTQALPEAVAAAAEIYLILDPGKAQ
jgi:hypothetical protein